MTDATTEMIDEITAITAEIVETIAETVEMINVRFTAMATKEETGANCDSANERSESCGNR